MNNAATAPAIADIAAALRNLSAHQRHVLHAVEARSADRKLTRPSRPTRDAMIRAGVIEHSDQGLRLTDLGDAVAATLVERGIDVDPASLLATDAEVIAAIPAAVDAGEWFVLTPETTALDAAPVTVPMPAAAPGECPDCLGPEGRCNPAECPAYASDDAPAVEPVTEATHPLLIVGQRVFAGHNVARLGRIVEVRHGAYPHPDGSGPREIVTVTVAELQPGSDVLTGARETFGPDEVTHVLDGAAPLGTIGFFGGYADSPGCPCGNWTNLDGFRPVVVQATAEGPVGVLDEDLGEPWITQGRAVACMSDGCLRVWSDQQGEARGWSSAPVILRLHHVAEPVTA